MIGNLPRSYLENREQFESMNRQESSIELVGTGAPQCSVLGTFLFFIYLNDLGVDETNSNLTLFADDCSLLHNEKIDEGNNNVNIKYKLCFKNNRLTLSSNNIVIVNFSNEIDEIGKKMLTNKIAKMAETLEWKLTMN